MKGRKIAFGKAVKTALKSAPTVSIPTQVASGGHHVTIVDANSDDTAAALGISPERQVELNKDLIAAVKDAIAKVNGHTQFTLLQILAIATANDLTDNELVYCTALIAEAFARRDFQSLLTDLTNGDTHNVSSETTTEDSLDADDQEGGEDPQGFAQFMAMLQGMGGAGVPAGAEDTDSDNADLDQNN